MIKAPKKFQQPKTQFVYSHLVQNCNFSDENSCLLAVRGSGDLGLTSQHRRQDAFILKPPETEVIRKEVEETRNDCPICQCCGFQRGDWISTLGWGKAHTRRYFPYQLQPAQSGQIQRETAHSLLKPRPL